MILFGVVLVTVLSVFLIFQPLLMGKKAPLVSTEETYSEVAHRKRVALLALRDVEYDFHAGKLDEEDYLALKGQVSAEALAALEAEAEALAAEGAQGRAAGVDLSGVEAEIAEMRRSIREGQVCTHCAHPNPKGSRFCAECGQALATTGATSA